MVILCCRSGIDENITTIKSKLSDLSVLIKDMKEMQKLGQEKKSKKLEEEKEAAEKIRGAAVCGLKRKGN